MILRLLPLLLAAFLATSAVAQTSPLIMKHADSLAVARKRGTLLLMGRVHFVHDSIQFRTQRAFWNKNDESVQCNGGFLFTHPSGYIKAQNGNYQKKNSIATASGDVYAGDSANSYLFTGEYLEYDRDKEILNMPQKPKLYQYEKKKDGNIDTVTVSAKRIIYNKGTSFAEAYGDVRITQSNMVITGDTGYFDKKNDWLSMTHVRLTQDDMVVTCDTGFFDHKNNWLSMKGNPTCDMKNYHLTGDSIFLVLDSAGKSLRSALVIRNAHGIQNEDPKKNAPGSVTEAFGDTLYAEFKNEKIERLYVNLNARGFFYETDLKEYRNLMDGDRLDLYFNQGKMDKAVVSGKAQSTYFYVKKDRSVSGKNEAAGDTIHILFDAQKNAVKSLKLLGSATMASGRYIDMEKEQRNKKAMEDSLKVQTGDNPHPENIKAKMDMMRKFREKAVAPPKDL
jgi:lipopolysaccharide export system protein LptA